MYDPVIGRFLQVDPERQFASSYVGMGNNPINGVDPTGGKVFDWFENQNGDIQWFDDNSSAGFSDADGNSWTHVSASTNLIVGTHNRAYTRDGVSEPLNTATFHLYDASVSHTDPVSAIVGNTVPADPSVSGTLREGVYDAEFASRGSYVRREIEDLAILLRDPVTKSFNGLPTTYHVSSKLTIGEIFIHMGNNYQRSLFDSNGNAYSTGCQTTGCYEGSRRYHNAFFANINDGWKGQYYLRRVHRTFHTYGSGPPSR